MRFGVQVATERVGWDDTVKMFHQAEEAGLDTAWVPDHFLPTLAADRGGSHPDAWTLLPALAARTSTIRIGVLVTCVGFRHPSVLARAAANVDLISGGRLEFGIGAGWMREEHEWFGMPFPPPGERARRLEEAVQLCKLLWTQPRASFKGRYYWLERRPWSRSRYRCRILRIDRRLGRKDRSQDRGGARRRVEYVGAPFPVPRQGQCARRALPHRGS